VTHDNHNGRHSAFAAPHGLRPRPKVLDGKTENAVNEALSFASEGGVLDLNYGFHRSADWALISGEN